MSWQFFLFVAVFTVMAGVVMLGLCVLTEKVLEQLDSRRDS